MPTLLAIEMLYTCKREGLSINAAQNQVAG